MTPFDILLLMIGLFVVIFLTVQRMLRALMTLAVTWFATLVAGLGYRPVTLFMAAIAGKNPLMVEGVMFLLVFAFCLIVGYILMHVAFPVTKLPKLGVIDYFLGFLLGIVVAVLVLVVIQNSLGLMVRAPWIDNEINYRAFASMVRRSALGDMSRTILTSYSVTFEPFFTPLPPALRPQ